jgi:hypothetical protein
MLPISGVLMRWQPTCKFKKNALYRLYDTKNFPNLRPTFATLWNMRFYSCQSGFIRANPVLFVSIRGLFVKIFFDTT